MENVTVEIPVASLVIRLVAVAVVFIIGQWLARTSRRWLTTFLEKQELPESIVTVLANITYFTIWLVTVLTILALLGVPVETLLTVVALVVIVMAVAMRESLTNFAATINFMLFKPFETGDLIETVGILGVVQEIALFSTIILSYDNKIHVFPNGLIQSEGITNLSKMGKIRIDLQFNISYGDDVQTAKQILTDLLAEDERIQEDPAPEVFVGTLGNSGVTITAWPFVLTEDYITSQFEIYEQGKMRLEEAGIKIPFQQQDIHLHQKTDS